MPSRGNVGRKEEKRICCAKKTFLKLYYWDKYDLLAYWKTPRAVNPELKKLKSETTRRKELNEQIRTR